MNVFCPIVLSGCNHTTNSTWAIGVSASRVWSASSRCCKRATSAAPCSEAPIRSAMRLVESSMPRTVCGLLVYTAMPSRVSASAVSRRLIEVVARTRSGCSATIASRLGFCGLPTCAFDFAAAGVSQ